MADLYHVKFKAFGVGQSIPFEFEGTARAVADRLVVAGFEEVAVYDEFDPRRVDGSNEVEEVPPVYEPDTDQRPEDGSLVWIREPKPKKQFVLIDSDTGRRTPEVDEEAEFWVEEVGDE